MVKISRNGETIENSGLEQTGQAKVSLLKLHSNAKQKLHGNKKAKKNPIAVAQIDPYIADEDREIARLEKLLGINSGK